jgi:hypothetical protein
VNKRVFIRELTSSSAAPNIVQMGMWRDDHEDQPADFLLQEVRRDLETLLIVLLVLFLLGGGGWGYSRWGR